MNQEGQSNLVDNPRYQGQAGGTDVQGPGGESRYGAMPLSTGTGMPGVDAQQHNLAAPNAQPSQAGYGSSQPGYGQHLDTSPNNVQAQTNPVREEFAKEQPGYGQPSQGQNTASLWPTPTAPPNARQSDLVGQRVIL